MLMIFSTTMILFSFSFFIMIMTTFISKKSFSDREKNSPFECGFDPKSSARLPFSLHFFLVAVIFLIFDVEITLLIPLVFLVKKMNIMYYWFIITTFIFILLGGLYHEWSQGALSWKI